MLLISGSPQSKIIQSGFMTICILLNCELLLYEKRGTWELTIDILLWKFFQMVNLIDKQFLKIFLEIFYIFFGLILFDQCSSFISNGKNTNILH